LLRQFFSRSAGIPPDDGLFSAAEIVAFNGYWQCQALDMWASVVPSGDIDETSVENATSIVITTKNEMTPRSDIARCSD